MKVYGTEAVHHRLAGCPDEKTFQKWAWLFVHAIARLEGIVVSLKYFPLQAYVCACVRACARIPLLCEKPVDPKLTFNCVAPQIIWNNRF